MSSVWKEVMVWERGRLMEKRSGLKDMAPVISRAADRSSYHSAMSGTAPSLGCGRSGSFMAVSVSF